MNVKKKANQLFRISSRSFNGMALSLAAISGEPLNIRMGGTLSKKAKRFSISITTQERDACLMHWATA